MATYDIDRQPCDVSLDQVLEFMILTTWLRLTTSPDPLTALDLD